MNARAVGLGVGIAVTPVAFLVAGFAAGVGHGNYVAARILFPLPMLSAYWFDATTLPAVAVACLQLPLYGWLIGAAGQKRRVGWIVVGLHCAAFAVTFIVPEAFFP